MHIPFCDSKCYYCAFNSYVSMFHLKNDYMKALVKQLKSDIINNLRNSDKKLETIFIGGGTPSCLDAFYYKEIFELLKPYITPQTEITTEANPNSATKEWLKKMNALGVNRVSFGVQSFNETKLKQLGRAHNKEQAIKAIKNAKSIGFDSINCDFIYGVENDTFESLCEDLDLISELDVEHISAYSLTIEEGTKFFNKSSIKIDDELLSPRIFEYLNKKGYQQYEISNFSKETKFQSKHNFGYWQHKEYLGIGAGAVGYVKSQRYYPLKDIEAYIKTPCNYEIEELTKDDIKTEKILLGLRCKFGFDKALLDKNEKERLNTLIEQNKVIEVDNTIYNNDFLLADEIALFLLN